MSFLGCAIHTTAPDKKGSTNFIVYPFVIRKCSANPLGHGHGYECHNPLQGLVSGHRRDEVVVEVVLVGHLAVLLGLDLGRTASFQELVFSKIAVCLSIQEHYFQ